MKKNKLYLGLSLLVGFGLFLSGCGGASSSSSQNTSSSPLSENSSSSTVKDPTSSSSEEHKHKFELMEEIINDCESDIIEIYVCHECGDEKKEQSDNYRAHKFGPWEVLVDPQEGEPGLQSHMCEVCGKVEEQPIDPLEHVHHYNLALTVRPTCEEDGYKIYKCECGDEYTEVYKEATGHNYGEWIVEIYPSLEETGLAKRVCKTNADHIDELILPVLNENDYSYDVLTYPTCNNFGFAIVYYNFDGISLSATVEIPPVDHSYGEWQLVKKPSYEEEGLLERVCAFCEQEKETRELATLYATAFYDIEIINNATCEEQGDIIVSFDFGGQHFYFEDKTPATGHSYTELPPSYIDATCDTPSYIKYSCTCGDYKLEENEPALGHEYHSNWEVITIPTDDELGLVRNYCDRNKEHYNEYNLPRLYHSTYTVQVINHASCVVEGLSVYTIYMFGSEESKVTFEVVTPKTNHNFEYDVRVQYATCKEDGKTIYTCHCGESYEEVFEKALGHNATYVPASDPTCENEGNKQHYLCERCSSYFLDIDCIRKADPSTLVIEPLGHSYSSWRIESYPTENYFGRLVRTCTRGCVEHKALCPLSDKDFYDYELVRANTCEKEGLEIYRYTINNQVIEIENILQPLGHTYGEWQKEIDPTFETEGRLVRVCARDENHLDYKVLPKLSENNYKYTVTVAPTCTEKGLSIYSYYFEWTYYEYEVELNELGHNYSEFVMVEEPTKEQVGLLERVCLNDEDHVDQIELPILNEENYVYELVTKPLCETTGLETYTITVEEQEFVVEIVLEKTGHSVDRENLYDEFVHYDVCACGSSFNEEEHTYIDGYCEVCGVHESIKYLTLKTKNNEPTYYVYGCSNEVTYLVLPKEYKGLPVLSTLTENALSQATKLETVIVPKTFDLKYSRVFYKVPSLRNIYFEGTLLDWFNTPITSSMFNTEELHLFVLDEEGNYYEVIDLVVPEEVVEINAYQFAHFTNIQSVYVPASVNKINQNTFENCKGLTSVFIEDGVKEIGNAAFYGCTSLEEVVLPNTLTFLKETVFQKCTSLKDVTIPTNVTVIEYGAFKECTSLENIEFNNLLERIESSAFYDCDSLTSVVVPMSVVFVGNGAFNGCDELLIASITNPNCYLETYVFYSCLKLEYIQFPINNDDITSFTNVVSSQAKSLTKVVINGGEVIPSGFFRDNKVIRTVTLASTIKSIGTRAFYECDSLEGINVPYGVEIINEYSFYDCDSLIYANIPSSVKSIENYAFYGCDKLTTLTLKEGLETIKDQVFYNCISLKEVIMPDSLESLGSLTFANNEKLETVEISKNSQLKTIDFRVFYCCYVLKEIYLPATLETLNSQAFYNCSSLKRVEFAYGIKLTSIEEEMFFGCQSLEYANIENCLYIETIKKGAFQQNYSLKSIEIPSNVEIIEYSAFAYGFNGKLTFALNSKLKEIGDYAFESYKQDTLSLPEGLEKIGSEAFGNLEIKQLVIPSTVKVIDDYAFRYVESVYLPSSIEELGLRVFQESYTYADKVNVYYNGTLEQALKIKFDEYKSLSGYTTWYFNDSKLSGDLVIDGISEVPAGLFSNSDITSIKFTSQITSIKESAFQGCSNLKSVDLTNQNELLEIENKAFANCRSLESLYIPSSVTSIEQDILVSSGIRSIEFEENTNLENFNLNMINNCYYLTSIKIPEGAKEIALRTTFTPLVSITIPSTATSISGSVDSNSLNQLIEVINLSSVSLPSSFETIRNIYTTVQTNNVIVENDELVFVKNNDNSYILAAYIGNNRIVNLPDEICGTQYEVHPSIFSEIDYRINVVVGEWFTYTDSYFNNYKVTLTKKESNNVHQIGDYLVKVRSGNITIIDILSNDKDIVLPETIEDKNYYIDPLLFEEKHNITSVYIPASVSVSGMIISFANCESLVSVTLEEGSNIQVYDFSNCKSLTTIPSKENLYDSSLTFKGCESLVSVELPDNIETIDGEMFKDCYSLTSITIPESVRRINSYAFSNCKSLKTIEIPSTIYSIPSYAFQGCTSLKTVSLPDTLTSINMYAFQDCTSLTSIEIPSSVTSLGSGVFQGCVLLRNVILSENLTRIASSTFLNCKSLYTITIPSNVEQIESYAFEYSGLQYIHFAEDSKLISLGSNVFTECNNLIEISLPSGITQIPYRCFYGAKSLVTVSLPEGVTSMGQEAFYNCYMLETINMPQALISIDSKAFMNCYKLKQLVFINNETTFSSSVFTNCYHLKIVVMPIELKDKTKSIFVNCYNLKEITYIEEN